MMTIKQFADLCSCNTQTLRYYDKIELLKPVKVDPWSGYRYYEASQAIDFVKIRNLQAADFTIEEIKVLLTKTDAAVYEAFNIKIASQAKRLERIKEIQRSYLTEKTVMEDLIQGMKGYLMSQLSESAFLQEFGMQPEDLRGVMKKVESYLQETVTDSPQAQQGISLVVDETTVRGAQEVAQKLRQLEAGPMPDTLMLGDSSLSEADRFNRAQYETLWEIRGWDFVRSFLDQIPPLERGSEYCFYFLLNGEKYTEDVAFGLSMLGAMAIKQDLEKINLGCAVDRSKDGKNYFALLRKKS